MFGGGSTLIIKKKALASVHVQAEAEQKGSRQHAPRKSIKEAEEMG
jgi:hypothetical protein